MAKVLTKDGKALFKCERCGLIYRDELTARKCEEFYSAHDACSTEIVREATGPKDTA